jgi:hypothetical protein
MTKLPLIPRKKKRPVEFSAEIRNRIRVAVAAYAYEIVGDPVMSDADYDELARSIRPEEATGNRQLDLFFRVYFEPDTGMWVHHHPDKPSLHRLYSTYYAEEAVI